MQGDHICCGAAASASWWNPCSHDCGNLEGPTVQALMFVRDLDTSLLGQNANGLEQFETLRQCTDELVNAILHVRQLLKRRRFEGDLFFTHA